MRAYEIPGKVFYYLRDMLDGELSSISHEQGCVFEAMHIPSHEVMIAHTCIKKGLDMVSFLNIWRFFAKKNTTVSDFEKMFRTNPDLQIVGGPFPGTEYIAKSGLRQKETVKILFGFELYCKGLEMDDPFLAMVFGVAKIANRVIRQNPFARLCYWQAFADPKFHSEKA